MALSRSLTVTMLAALAATSLSGCVAAVIPVGAAALLGKKEIDRRTRYKRNPAVTDKAIAEVAGTSKSGTSKDASPSAKLATAEARAMIDALGGEGSATIVKGANFDPNVTAVPPISEAPPASAIGGFAAAMPASAQQLADYWAGKVKPGTKPTRGSVALSPFGTMSKPDFTVCEGMPPALLVDLDGTTETSVPVSDALIDLFDGIREKGGKVIFIASVPEKDVNMLATDLIVAGLGPATRNDTLFLIGDRKSTGKDSLRWKIASSNCIVAMAGDRYEDFSDQLAVGSNAQVAAPVRQLAGAGWFILPELRTPVAGGQP